jgi:UDP-glucose 4-epimerase
VTSYRDRRVLAIGGLGFIGVNLVARLVDAGARVTAVTRDRAVHAEHARVLEAQGVVVEEADIRDAAAMAIAVTGQEVIFNLSGQSGAVRSLEDPYTDLDINVRGNLVLLEALREHNPQAKLVFVGSRLQYGRVDALPVREDTRAEPLCLHAVHKSAVEQYLGVYRRLFGLRSVVARVTNPYGPGQPSSRTAYGVINRLIHLAIADQPLTIYGDGTQQRDYLYVDDLVAALLLLGAGDATDGQTYNVGSGAGIALVDVAKKVIALAGGGTLRHVEWPALDAIIETGDFVADVERLRALGWQPAVSLDEGLERTIAFYRTRVAS